MGERFNNSSWYDMLPRYVQLKRFRNILSNCMMSKTHVITKIFRFAEHTVIH